MFHADVSAPSRTAWLKAAVLSVGYAVACLVMLAPIFNFSRIASANYEGDTRLVIWMLAWDNHAVLDHVRPLFDANMFYPARNALAYSEHLVGISLFTLPVYWATRNPVLAYNVAWLLCYALAALAAHALAWRYTRDHLASAFGGVAFAFCFFRMHHGHGHLPMVWAFWIPLSLIAMDRWVDRPTWGRMALFVVTITMQALASWYQAVLVFMADAIFLAWAVLVERRVAAPERVVRFGAQAIAGAVLSLACVWPFARHYTVLERSGPREAAGISADVAGFLVPPENTFAGQWLLAHGINGPRWIWGEQTVYLGWTAIVLAAIGGVLAIRSYRYGGRRLAYFIALALASVALAFGPSAAEVATNQWGWSPFGLLMRIPGVALFRAPARFSELLTLAVAVLGAAGCAAIHQRWPRAGWAITAAAIAAFLFESYVVKFPGGPPRPYPIPQVYRQLASMPPGAVVSLPDYADSPESYLEASYVYFSTAHWHPIANGYSRAAPPGFQPLMNRLKTFPAPDSLAAMRETGIRYVVVHAALLSSGGAVAQTALDNSALTLAGRSGNDFLFELTDAGR